MPPFRPTRTDGRNLSARWVSTFSPALGPTSSLLRKGFGQVPIRPPIHLPAPVAFNESHRDLMYRRLRSPGASTGAPDPGSTSWSEPPIPPYSSESSGAFGTSSGATTGSSALTTASSEPPGTSPSTEPMNSSSEAPATSYSLTSTQFSSADGCSDPGPLSCANAFDLAMFEGPFCPSPPENPCPASYAGGFLCSCWTEMCQPPPPDWVCDGTTPFGYADLACCYSNGTALYYFDVWPCTCDVPDVGGGG